MESFKRQECQATIIQENSIYIFIVAFRIMTRLLQTVGEILHYTEHRGSYFETGRP